MKSKDIKKVSEIIADVNERAARGKVSSINDLVNFLKTSKLECEMRSSVDLCVEDAETLLERDNFEGFAKRIGDARDYLLGCPLGSRSMGNSL